MSAVSFAIPFVLLGGALAWVSIYFWSGGRDLTAAGVEARAAITRKFRNPADTYLFGLENCFVTADFVDASGYRRIVDIRVPSRQWRLLRAGTTASILYLPYNPQRARVISKAGQTLLNAILIFSTAIGAILVLFGFFFAAAGVGPAGSASRSLPNPPPSQFDKSGVARVEMRIGPHHDRIASIDLDSGDTRIRELPSGTILATAKGNGWRGLDWKPDGSRIAVRDGPATLVLDAATLRILPAEEYSWNPPAPQLAACADLPPVWDPSGTKAASACGSEIRVAEPSAVRLLRGHRDRVLGLAWSPSGRLLASVGEDNYVRIWDPETQRCLNISEDLPYPRTLYFAAENTVVAIDVALRQYSIATSR